MAIVEMLMPKMGESIIEGTVLTWLKNEGDTIEQDESVLEVATDKVDTEVPSTHAGVLKQILAKEGDVIAVGAPIAIIETSGEEKSAPVNPEPIANQLKDELIASAPENTASILEAPINSDSLDSGDERFYSPLVQSIAKEEGISKAELSKIPGSGKDARVTKQDMMDYLKSKSASAKPATSIPSISAPKIQMSISGGDEIIEMDRMRKMIAQRMLESKRISAHVTSFVETDMTNIVLWREKNKLDYKAKFGESITYTPFFIEAVSKAIRDFPMINISVDGDRIIRKKDINVGMAVALPNGNLIVPIIRNADQLNLVGISKKVNELANLARNNKLNADHLAGGTYTVSNVGSFGNVMGTPIIPQPQVAIMAVGAIVKKPAVIETPTGDVIAIRHKMFLSHSYDHRVVDGSLGGRFVKRVSDYLEAFDINTPL
ncbi:dihydrolipoamide acetyltransferase family protein [Algoriphagus aquimarinus]|uniref:Dihydrolipoamide acetyltransferase component of pyruvate dehydrogenase complex n=1 Tax=Algoriphagus aquimarinus TaxID=237018 RepID=A0A1I1C7L7_9BACT|nr:dihydrolipoamide acetyltransferase family protein [Algoriphagus aquimarinus]SFB56750.1 2-oxoglutarate dehydrogenase E2 component (dihydrolipoamide succinyltransferase) [Algoriphagus aquimarinus]|tara:strand:+ start:44310 stop:45605 length:1296 start_codon:yes stop_codon:yes gene_type:complete